MQTYHWVVVLMVTLAMITFGMFMSDLQPRQRGRALGASLLVAGALLALASVVFSNLE